MEYELLRQVRAADPLSRYFQKDPGATAVMVGGSPAAPETRVDVWNGGAGSGEEVLSLIKLSCETFDGLAAELLPGYDRRGPLLLPGIETARQVCRARPKT